MTSKTWRRHNVSIWSENRRRKHNVVTTIEFGRSNDVGKTTLWQRCFDVVRRCNQKTTKNQRCHSVVCQPGWYVPWHSICSRQMNSSRWMNMKHTHTHTKVLSGIKHTLFHFKRTLYLWLTKLCTNHVKFIKINLFT